MQLAQGIRSSLAEYPTAATAMAVERRLKAGFVKRIPTPDTGEGLAHDLLETFASRVQQLRAKTYTLTYCVARPKGLQVPVRMKRNRGA